MGGYLCLCASLHHGWASATLCMLMLYEYVVNCWHHTVPNNLKAQEQRAFLEVLKVTYERTNQSTATCTAYSTILYAVSEDVVNDDNDDDTDADVANAWVVNHIFVFWFFFSFFFFL